jgi:hypothetical protein
MSVPNVDAGAAKAVAFHSYRLHTPLPACSSCTCQATATATDDQKVAFFANGRHAGRRDGELSRNIREP